MSAYNICSGQTYTIGEMARRMSTVLDGPAPVVNNQYRAYDVTHVAASPRAAREGLGFEASIGPHEGITELATAPLRHR